MYSNRKLPNACFTQTIGLEAGWFEVVENNLWIVLLSRRFKSSTINVLRSFHEDSCRCDAVRISERSVVGWVMSIIASLALWLKTHRWGAYSAQKLSWSAAQQTDQRPTMTFINTCATPLKLTIIDIAFMYFNFQLIKPFRVIRINRSVCTLSVCA